MKNKIIFLIFICLNLYSVPIFAQEVIKAFESNLQVQADGSVIVTERITVYHEGKKIRRGIYRDLPTEKGERYELIEVNRNGHHEPSFVEKKYNSYRINTGDKNDLPNPRTSIFEIKYKVWNILKSYNGYDEVYWNVTGDQWNFPIETVLARVILPDGAEIIQQASYIGNKGSQNPATYKGNGEYAGAFLFPGEQLTIAVGFTPGIVSVGKYVSQGNLFKTVLPFILFFIYLGFLILVWNKKGRDPVGRTIMPQYDTPIKELTAAQACCLYNKKNSVDIFPVSLIQMITNGFLKLTIKKKKKFLFSHMVYILKKTGKAPSNFEEECISVNQIKLDGQYHVSTERLIRKMESKMKKKMKFYHCENRWWVLLPTFFFLFFLFWMWIGDKIEAFWISLILTGLGSFVFKTFLRQLIYTFIYIFMIFGLFYFKLEIYQPLLVLFVISTSSIFSFLMYQPTEKGQRMIEYLEGLKMFLTTTQMPALKQKGIEGKLTEKGMEELFPYAMALGLEKEWERKFKKLFDIETYDSFIHSHPYVSVHFIRAFSSAICHSSNESSGGSGGFGCAGGGSGGGGGGGR